MAQVEINLKSIGIILGLLGALIGNVFIVGKIYSDFEIMKAEMQVIKDNNNILTLKQEILELGYKIKSLRLEMDGEFSG